MNHDSNLFRPVTRLLDAYFSGHRRAVRKNLGLFTAAFLRFALSVRVG
jgi:hypothetical protein